MPQPPMGNGIDDRGTPRALFDSLNLRWRFTLDGAASHANALLSRYSTLDGTYESGCLIDPRDGLQFPWHGERVYINPPYGRGLLAPFVKRAASGEADVVVALLPVRTDQAWFHDHVVRAGGQIEWIRGRVKYDGLAVGAPFPSMIVTWA